MFWLDPEKRWTRKLAELMITLRLEQTLSKQQIFEDYANQIYLGRRGSFSIHGFGEAAEAYFGKDIRQITLPEAAKLAGMIQRPGYLRSVPPSGSRARAPQPGALADARRTTISDDRDYALAVDTPLTLAKGAVQSLDAPYFVDLVNEFLQSQFQDVDFQANAFRVYTTLDLDLQRAAGEAIRDGMQGVDEQIRKQKRFKGQTIPGSAVALVAIDPHTGEIKALAGGRNYGVSQLNHVLAKRQPGSIFKPFVYAAALNTAIEGGPRILTASTMVVDEPTTFWYDNKPYEPSNFKHEFYGTRHPAPGAGAFAERGHREGGRDGGLRQRGGHGQAGRHELRHPAHAGRGAGRLRSHAAGDGRRLHHLRQPGRIREAQLRLAWCAPRTARTFTTTRRKSARCSIRAWPT